MRGATTSRATASAALAALTLLVACGGSPKRLTSPSPADAARTPSTATSVHVTSSAPTSSSVPQALTGTPSRSSTDLQAIKALAMPQQPPANVNLFPNQFLYRNVNLSLRTEGQYLTGTPMAPSTAAIPSDSQVSLQLQSYLHEQFGSNVSAVTAASAIFGNPAVRARIPDTRLRAAFAALAGTSLTPAQQYFLDNAAYFTGGITFDALDSFKAPSETQRSYNGSTVGARVLINRRYQHEPWQLFTVLIGHELQHTQSQAVPVDEAITNFELAIEYTEILARHPAMAYWNTELSRRLNGFAQLFLDSRTANSAQNAMIISGGGGLFPGSNNSATDIWTDYHGGGIAPAPTVAQQVLAELLPGVPLPSPLKYSQDTAALFAHMADPYLPPTTRLQVSVLLQLITPAEIAKALGNSAEQAISTFSLQPYLDVVAKGQYTPS